MQSQWVSVSKLPPELESHRISPFLILTLFKTYFSYGVAGLCVHGQGFWDIKVRSESNYYWLAITGVYIFRKLSLAAGLVAYADVKCQVLPPFVILVISSKRGTVLCRHKMSYVFCSTLRKARPWLCLLTWYHFHLEARQGEGIQCTRTWGIKEEDGI